MTTPVSSNPLTLSVLIYRGLVDKSNSGREISGILPLDWEAASVVAQLEEHQLIIAEPDAERRIRFSPSGHRDDFFAFSWPELLSANSRQNHVPARFYLADSDYLYESNAGEVPDDIRRYLDTCHLIKFLTAISDHAHDTAGIRRLVFLGKEKLELPIEYVFEDVKPLEGLKEFVAEFTSDIHTDQKKTIARTVLSEMFADGSPSFSQLLDRFADFRARCIAGYQLYVSEFSFQKIKNEVEKEKLEFTLKLNKIFSEIQSQLLVIPVALILAGGQLERDHGFSMKNLVILGGCLVFAFLMALLIRNQRNSLAAVKEEIDNQWGRIEGEHALVASKFRESYASLNKRYQDQRRLIFAIDILVSMSLIVTAGLAFLYQFLPPKASLMQWIVDRTLGA